ncbi:MAG: type VI secretion system baseplate subunit TssK [Azoarcus sp.]|jgi:type VI secretion system protein ImpJ|nr:type VI secretion system baseplate subunit TssK [Azoarcus sp.]
MSYINKVVWSEGMFLRPQHFQQQERYIESYIHRCAAAHTPFFWGFSELVVEPGALVRGTVQIRRAIGVMPDGTPFDIEADKTGPVTLDFPPDKKNIKVVLALPPSQEGIENVIYNEHSASAARYVAATFESGDGNESGAEAAEIQVGRPRFRLLLENAVPSGWVTMGVAHVSERQTDNQLRLDDSYIPPTLHCGGQLVLSGFIKEIENILQHRADAITARLAAGGRGAGGVSDVGEFLTLTSINRWHPLISHLSKVRALHPERLFSYLLSLAGEMSTFSEERRRMSSIPVYIHDDLGRTFSMLMGYLRKYLAVVLDQTVIRIELVPRKFGISVAVVQDRALFKQASFVLAVNAQVPPEKLLSQFPAHAKIGPVEKIRDLMNLQLPGVPLRPLPIAPRELPFHAGYSYFELDTQNEFWQGLDTSAALALHIAGDFPGLALECWAIRK